MTHARLQRLEIEDYELIERAEVEFSEGLTVCSGETGSGKTMLLGALDFVLGARSSGDIVRAGATRARVTLQLDADDAAREWLGVNGFSVESGEPAILVREMTPAGKSTARVNGSLATSGQLRALGDLCVDAVGQHEAQRLVSAAFARDALDAFAGDQAVAAAAALFAAHERVGALERALSDLRAGSERAAGESAFARFAFDEIEAAKPEPGEDERLRERRTYLAEGAKIRETLEGAHAAIVGGSRGEDAGAVEALGAAAAALAGVARYAPSLAELSATLAALQSDAQDAALALGRELEMVDVDPAELETISARLDTLDGLKRKFGGTLEAVLSAREGFAAGLERGASRDENEARLASELEIGRAELARLATALSAARAAAAPALERRVANELTALAMPAARFAVRLEALERIGSAGAESVSFELSPNPGEPLRPLVRAASGGELSRVLLAIVVATAERSRPPALVFDEIDAGVGGATATAVGVRLGALARATQVVCITHLAQIASWADAHYALRKRERGGTTTIEVVALSGAEALTEEIARMLSGSSASVALDHARALLRDVRAAKAKGSVRAAS